jgi:superoxide reductase
MGFGDILRDAGSEGKEKHVPHIEVRKAHGSEAEDLVHVLVGKETPHPNTIEHHIAWIELFGVKTDGQVVDLGRADFAPSFTAPSASFHVPVEQFKAFHALAYCNIHGVWQGGLEVW